MRSSVRIPRPISSFIGRGDAITSLARLLGEHRLVTLTGPGGSGKTRLSIELAWQLHENYPDGVTFVPLAPIRDPALLPSTIAQRLGLQDSRGRPLTEHLADYLGGRTLLLVLDNFEHLLGGAGMVADLLGGGGDSRLIVTSRAPLRISGEQSFPVPPLPPESDGVHLFAARAQAQAPDFVLDESNQAAVTGIVRRLDGLPLAIELAAARVRVLPPQSLLSRLDHSLSLLVDGNRDLPDRQQTLRSTIAWSYELLSPAAQRLFAIFSAFRGGAGLGELEAVSRARDVVEAVTELVDQNLLRAQAGLPRYTMLETVREFAAERLVELPDSDPIRAGHAALFSARVEPLDRPPIWQSNEFLAGLDLDHDNIRAALDWFETNDPPAALHMAAKLSAFWSIRGHFTEGRRRLERALELVPEESPDRVAARNGLGWLAADQGERQSTYELYTEAIAAARSIGDRIGEGTALFSRGRILLSGTEVPRGLENITAAQAIFQEAGDEKGVAATLLLQGAGGLFTAELDLACARLELAVEYCERLGLTTMRARALQLMGIARLRTGRIADGRAALAEGIPVVFESGDRFGIAIGLGALTVLAVRTSRPRLALRLLGVRDEFERVNQVRQPEPIRRYADEVLAPARARLGPSAELIRAEGRAMGLDAAMAAALSEASDKPWGDSLTARETEVAQLVATGLTNRQISERLFVSVRTVETHVDRALTKLGFKTRSQLTAWVHLHGLLAENT
ncbi:LuxR C-terminal-related transcriptional regulator [Arthrobacter cupressi]|uniref:Predicted ATPase n=1 Tax=Arthrobacter cupressi TaxID=1045773 RepID=A0A1G8QFQ0_9MICC|nr:LuxR C-terminal-related transcriptional regulator [Arthrobacter cupressi]NYD78124.1 non-specific serine/threonine protein kinase [Arthrobacter cupressi]SDJ03413.1 Predicted ATPase [Arthrobacter cupressi]